MFLHQNPVYATPLPVRATCPTRLILIDLITRTIWGEVYRWFSSPLFSFLLVPLRLKYSPQHPILQHHQSTFLPERPSFTPIQNNRHNCSSAYLTLYIFGNFHKNLKIKIYIAVILSAGGLQVRKGMSCPKASHALKFSAVDRSSDHYTC